MTGDAIVRRRFTVRGRVQGVGFRWFVQETAGRAGLSGWVRNDPAGTVTGEAVGRRLDVDAFVEALRTGPPASRVEAVELQPDEPVAVPGERQTRGRFEIR